MSNSPDISNEGQPRDAAYWAQQGTNLKVTSVPTGALNINVEGRQAVSPLQGFGQMWQKTFWVRLADNSLQPTDIVKTWKEHFTEFWPKGNRFYAPLTGIAPGEVALIKMAMPGGMPLSTGVMVLYADDESFTVMTPQGHVFAGWNTFSAYEEDDTTIIQIQVLIRPGDLFYEIGFRFFGASQQEDRFWEHTLASLVAYLGAEGQVEKRVVCIDPRLQWRYIGNVWHNAFIRSMIYIISSPLRLLQKKSR